MTISESKGQFFTKRIDSNRESECSSVNACRASEATQQQDCRVRRELGASQVVPAISSTPPAEVSSPSTSREKRFGNS